MSKDDVLGFVRCFKDEILIPLAKRGKLNEKMATKAVNLYSKQLEDKREVKIKISKEGPFSEFHTFYASEFKLGEITYPSMEHYIGYQMYVNSDSEFATFILQAKNAQMAHRRIKSGVEQDKRKNFNWEQEKEETILYGYKALIKLHPEFLKQLVETGTKEIVYETVTTGSKQDEENLKYVIVRVLNFIRKEAIQDEKKE